MEVISQLHALTGGTKKQKRLYKKGLDCAIAVINSPRFLQDIEGFKYRDSNRKKHLNFKRNYSTPWMQYVGREERTELSNKDIYSIIMSGWDMYSKEKDGDIDTNAKLYHKRLSSAMGYSYSHSLDTYSNTAKWRGTEREIVAGVAGNIIHEYMHNLGFGHDYKWNPTREFTVPYAIGYIVRNLVLETDICDRILGVVIEYDRVEDCYWPWYYFGLKKVCRYVIVEGM